MAGSDILFGDSEDDDLIGGYGNDWISGGTGRDGVIGDDGRIYTGRYVELPGNNTAVANPADSTHYAELLNGILGVDELNKEISTPGNIQQAIINPTVGGVEGNVGQLVKQVDITPFSQELGWMATQDEWAGLTQGKSDDIIYGGLGSDFLHGASGDDAISGAEALLEFFEAPINPGNVLRYSQTTGEFAAYDEFDPLRKIELHAADYMDPDTDLPAPGALWKPDDTETRTQFFLNFDETEGVLREGGEVPTNGNDTIFAPDVHDDGDDKIFGDLGNDWLVGGTGRDNLYGGWGDDLMNADDNHDTAEEGADPTANDQPDTHPTYQDRAYGGAGRDILIGNTGGDRLIDWAGEFNSYIVPFAPFGEGTVTRMLQPQLPEFLYALSASDGADPTRAVDSGSGDPARSGEPYGELGLVKQQDDAWQSQTGAPSDPQPGNIPGGARDVLRGANFDNSSTSGFFADSGVWKSSGGVLQVAAESIGGDAVSVFHVGDALPGYFEIQASVMAIKPTSGWKANSYIIFDYQSEHDFKFAGIDVAISKLVMGHRDASGWVVDKQAVVTGGVKADRYYNILVAINGVNATLRVDNKLLFTHTYQPRIEDGYAFGLNTGMVGVGSDNSRGAFDNIRVQVLPPEVTLNTLEDFNDGVADLFTGGASGAWSVSGGRYGVTPGDTTGFSLLDLGPEYLAVSSYLEFNGTVNATGMAGYVFDRYGDTSFKFAAIDAANSRLVIGHYTSKSGWAIDASVATPIAAGADHTLNVTLKGTTVSATLNPKPNGSAQAIVGFAFNAATVDGNFGLLATGGPASFDDVRVKTDDPAFRSTTSSNMIAATAVQGADAGSTLTQAELDAIAEVVISQWTDALGNGDPRLAAFGDVRFSVGELPGGELGLMEANTIVIDGDGAGLGWYVDVSPAESSEFRVRLDRNVLAAAPESEAYGRFDLVTVLAHELGHMLGFDHDAAGRFAVMAEDLDPGVRYQINAEQAPAEPVAAAAGTSGMPAFDLYAGLGGTAGIDWQGEASGSWRVALSPYAPPKPAKAVSPNLAEFDAQPLAREPASQDTGFDSLGRALLGKGKTDR
jgi:Ca2+-binding RTX toxin-like protein